MKEIININDLYKKSEQKQEVMNLLYKYSVSFNDLYNDEFIQQSTKFKSIKEMLNKCDYQIHNIENFKSEEWKQYVIKNTDFDSWEEMENVAIKRYRRKNKL